ncbi:MAG TPA: AAA family ATPase [Streptosporangiaceae bacterium]|nr:AAA family ATPase [Streptosporangiaceae bacterium]
MIMPRRWSIGRTALVLLFISIAALAATWYAARLPWFYVTLFLVAWGWLLAGIQVVNFLHARRHSDPPARLRNSARPAARAARRPGPEPGGTSRARRFPGVRARQDGLLGPDARVTLAAERQASGVDEVFAALDRELVGLVPVKQKVEEVAALLMVDRVRQRFGLDAPRPNLHMCFTGPPGTGKTTVALRMADLLHRLGYLESGHLVHAMRDDLVGEFIGHTAPKTKRILDQAMGGVLFIDEAYYLYRAEDSKDYGQEAIEILLQVMENDRDKLVVILAGYKDRMEHFFGSNPGMSSRIAHHLDFAPYGVDELMAISQVMLEQARYYLSDEAQDVFREYLVRRMKQPRFAYARSVRNELERSRLRHAHRLATEPDRRRSRDDLMRIEPPDILASQAFSAAVTADPAG